MRVLQIFNRYLDRGGEEASVERISDVLSTRHSIFHCFFDSRQLGNLTSTADRLSAAARMAWNPNSAARLSSHCAAVKPDVLLCHNLFPAGTASLLAEASRLRLPVVNYIHNFRPYSVNGYLWANDRIEPAGLKKNFLPEIFAGSWQGSRARTAFYAAILTAMHAAGMFRRIAAWVAISEFVGQKFIEAGVPAGKVHTIPHSWTPLPSCPPPQDGGYYLFLGRLISAKGVRTLLDAWERIEAQLGDKSPRLLIGGEGPLAPEVAGRANRSRAVQYLGLVGGTDKAALVQGCRAMLAPSLWWEGLGLVTYEAYDYGKPMLAARSGGLTETVRHGITGLLHEPGNSAELASHVLEIDSSPERRAEMGRQGRQWLLDNTGSDQWLDRFDAVLASVVRHEPGSVNR